MINDKHSNILISQSADITICTTCVYSVENANGYLKEIAIYG